jgi:ubiquinone/menaquinone biosynthesis C-methylase UbiE
MSNSSAPGESFSLSMAAAERYESAFVPALFAQWAPLLCDAAGLESGQRVLDVACGTGILARAAADRVAPDGRVVGVDLNEAMLSVARRVAPDLEFRQGDAVALPFSDQSFDAVLSQMALMFFSDRRAALREMARVASTSGTVAVLVPAALSSQDAFAPFVDLAVRHAGAEAASLLGAYFVCGDLDELTRLVTSVGLQITTARTLRGSYRAPSAEAFVTTEVESTPLLERISTEAYRRIHRDAPSVLAPFTLADGRIEAPFDCNLVAARRPAQLA